MSEPIYYHGGIHRRKLGARVRAAGRLWSSAFLDGETRVVVALEGPNAGRWHVAAAAQILAALSRATPTQEPTDV